MAGTTVQVGDLVPVALREALAPLALTVDDEAVRAVRGRSKKDAIAALWTAAHDTTAPDPTLAHRATAPALARFNRIMEQRLPEVVRPVPGTEDVFAWLRQRGVLVALTTGFGRPSAEVVLQTLGWGGGMVDTLVTADDVVRGRPAPDLIAEAMRRTGVGDPNLVIAVGDTIADLDAARRAGVAARLAVSTGAHTRAALEAYPGAVVLTSIAQLPAWLETR